MPKLKPFNISGMEDVVDAEPTTTYRDIPAPPKGRYKVRLKRMTHGTIRSGDNAGAPRFNCLLELIGPSSADKYMGYGFWHGLNLTKQGAGYVNQFLNGLAGGSESAQRSLRKAFWGADIVVDEDGHVQRIGKTKIGSPDGQLTLEITSRLGKDRDGNARAEVVSVLVPQNDSASFETEDDEDEDDDDILEEDEDDEDEQDEDDDDEDDSGPF